VKPDAILTWPVACDYPLWRRQLREQRDHLARVIVVFSEHHVGDLSGFVREQMSDLDVEFYPPEESRGDWRDRAVNAALDLSDAEWVLFTEQDFLVHRPLEFWHAIRYSMRPHDRFEALGWREGDRWHPSFLLVRRAVVDSTTRYFGSDPVDHFWTFGKELDALVDVCEIIPTEGQQVFSHQAGLSDNHRLLESGGEPNYHPEEFADYLRRCLNSGEALKSGWAEYARGYVRRMGG
jgi:hypothetical protein